MRAYSRSIKIDGTFSPHCQDCGDKWAEAMHVKDGVKHKFTGGANPETIYKNFISRPDASKIQPSYNIASKK